MITSYLNSSNVVCMSKSVASSDSLTAFMYLLNRASNLFIVVLALFLVDRAWKSFVKF